MRRPGRSCRVGQPPSAIIYNNESVALGGCRALRDLGLQPGRDVAVLVVVSGPFCSYMSPALTGFSVPLEPLGRRLAEILLAAMPQYAGEGGPSLIREVWPLEFLPGETDLPVRTGAGMRIAAVPVATPVVDAQSGEAGPG